MMRLKSLATGLCLSVVLAGPGWADPLQDQVTAALEAQGYDVVSVGRTWLGRVRILAESDALRREIVLNPTTGEVLRDYSVRLVADGATGLGFESDDDAGSTDPTASARTTVDPLVSALEATADSVAAPVAGQGQ
jgi:hypothetical protein